MQVKRDPGNSVTIDKLKNIDCAFKLAIQNGYTTIGENLKRTNKFDFESSKSGRFYGSHQASAPGEPPAKKTGELERSLFTRVTASDSLFYGADAPYASFLEKGTDIMEARPYLSKAIRDNEGNNVQVFHRYLREYL